MCFAKLVLSSITIYNMQPLWFPQGVCEDIDRTCRNFLWPKNCNTRSWNLVKLEKIIKPKGMGGLGMKLARTMNVALLGTLI